MSDVKIREIGVIADLVGGCGVARWCPALQPDGDVTPCVYMPKTVIGSLRHERLGDIRERSELLQSMRERDNLWGRCAVCGYKMLCGGCRARAQSCFDDLTAPDIGCVHNKAYIGSARHGAALDPPRVGAGSGERRSGT